MANKKHGPEEVVAKLRRVDVLVSAGKSAADAIRSIGVIEATYHVDRDGPCRNLPQHGIGVG